MSDAVTDDYNRRCGAGDDDLLHSVDSAAAHLPPTFRDFRSDRLLGRPLFVSGDDTMRFGDQLRSLFDLLTELPKRVLDGDLDLYCAAVGLDGERADVVRRFAHLPPMPFGRADAYRVDGAFKLLELNVCGSVGGIDTVCVAQALSRVPAFAAFADDHELTFTDTGRAVTDAMRSAVGDTETVTVALVVPDGEFDDHRAYLLPYAELFRAHGLCAVAGEIGDVSERHGRLFLHGRQVDVVHRLMSDLELARAGEAVLRAHEEGRVVLWTGLENQRVNTKGALALLADERVRAALTVAERELVDDVVPWTRQVTAGDLVDYCRSRREHLVLKPSHGYGGDGIAVGWQTDDADWAALLDEGAGRAWVVQERVVPAREQVIDPDTGRVDDWVAVWGVFVTEHGYSGSHIRAVPADSPDPIIRRKAEGARNTGVFHYPGAHDRIAS